MGGEARKVVGGWEASRHSSSFSRRSNDAMWCSCGCLLTVMLSCWCFNRLFSDEKRGFICCLCAYSGDDWHYWGPWVSVLPSINLFPASKHLNRVVQLLILDFIQLYLWWFPFWMKCLVGQMLTRAYRKKNAITIFSSNSGQVVLGMLSRLRWEVLDTLLETTRKGSTLHEMFQGVPSIFAAESELSIIRMLWNL